MDHDMPFKTPELDDPVLEWATCGIFVCYAHLNIFTWNLRDINVYYYYYKQ